MEQEERRQRAVDYLLRRMSKEQRESYEELYFANPGVLEEMEIVRQDLIDEYIRGELQGDDLSQFERLLLELPALRSDVEFTKSVVKLAADRQPEKQQSKAQSGVKKEASPSLVDSFLWWFRNNNRKAIVFASALAIAALSFLIWREASKSNEASLPHREIANSNTGSDANRSAGTGSNQQDGNRNNSLQNSNQSGIADSRKPGSNANKNSTRQAEQPPQQNQDALAKSFTLTHTVMATQGGNLLVIEPDDKNVKFIIPLTQGNANARYRAVIRDVDGARKTVYESGPLVLQQGVSGRVLAFTIPSDLFTAQYYLLSVYLEKNGQQELDKFSFRVEKQ